MWQSSKAHPAAYCPPGSICGMLSIPRALPPVTQSSALQAPECMWVLFFTTDKREMVLWGKEEIKKFVAFPGLAPLQPDAYVQPRKQASLSDHPHPSGLPIGRREINKTK